MAMIPPERILHATCPHPPPGRRGSWFAIKRLNEDLSQTFQCDGCAAEIVLRTKDQAAAAAAKGTTHAA